LPENPRHGPSSLFGSLEDAPVISFQCVECGARYEVQDDLAGKAIRCRRCSAPSRVPTLKPTKAKTPTAPAENDGPAKPPIMPVSRWRLRGTIIGAGLALAIIGVAVGLVLNRGGEKPREAERPAPSVEVPPKGPSARELALEEELKKKGLEIARARTEQAKRAQDEVAAKEQERQRRESARREAERVAAQLKKERQERLQREFLLLPGQEQEAIKEGMDALNKRAPADLDMQAPGPMTVYLKIGHTRFLVKRYQRFFDTDDFRPKLIKWGEWRGVGEFIKVLKIEAHPRLDDVKIEFALAWSDQFFPVEKIPAGLIDVARQIAKTGFAGLSEHQKTVYNENRRLFDLALAK
jgi:DNA-directed RNA polymerase subunit RPC12/RpoP